MLELAELDSSTPLHSQLQGETGPIVVINTFVAPEERTDEVLTVWEADASYMMKQPGYISTQMHRGTANSRILVNIAVWESAEALSKALSTPEFQEKVSHYPDGTLAYPHVFEKVAVDGVCVA